MSKPSTNDLRSNPENLLLKKTILTVLLLVLLRSAHSQHNVVLLIADDLGTDYLGFYEDHVDTADVPNIRSLLSDGVRFQNAMSNPVCSATRAGMLTGRYSFKCATFTVSFTTGRTIF
ncbi:MAG: sulfatase-like hydrolase/transferase [Bacteroidetes bacterium]|nr:sulfatase-like hydrolase/transferase [Bacteroidota bacterium]